MADEVKKVIKNVEIYGFRIHHIIPSEIFDDNSVKAILNAAGVFEESRGNKVALFAFSETAEVFSNSPQIIKDALKKAGFAPALHNDFHNKYNSFLRLEIRDILDAVGPNGNPALLDNKIAALKVLFNFASKVSSGEISGVADSVFDASVVDQAWEAAKIADVAGFSRADASPELLAIVDASIDASLVDASGNNNNEFRIEKATAVTNELKVASDSDPRIVAEADKSLALIENPDGKNAATSAGIRTIVELIKLAGSELTVGDGTQAQKERRQAEVDASVANSGTSEQNSSAIEGVVDGLAKAVAKFGGDESGSLKIPRALPDDVRLAMESSLTSMTVGIGGGFAGDTVEFINFAYEPFLKGVRGDGWDDFWSTVADYGFSLIISAVVIGSSVAIASVVGAAVGLPLGAVVAAGWAAYGLYDAIVNGSELFDKITEDLSELFFNGLREAFANNEIKDTVQDLIDYLNENIDPPESEDGTFVFVADDEDDTKPDSLIGSEENDQIFGKNGASIFGREGDDLLIHTGSGGVFGGKGDDIILVRDTDDIEVDAGDGNDIIISAQGSFGQYRGGLGRDLIYVTSEYAQVYGDTVDGIFVSEFELNGEIQTSLSEIDPNDETHSDLFWFFPNVIVKDASPVDRLQFFGLPLIGGNNDVPIVSGGGGFGGLAAIGGTGLAAINNPYFTDFVLPFIKYRIYADRDELFVLNSFTQFFSQETLGDGTVIAGAMRFDNFEDRRAIYKGSDFFSDDGSLEKGVVGDLGLTFKIANATFALAALIPGFPGGVNRLLPMIDSLYTFAGAASRVAEAANWKLDIDPLVLDLDGDGIETISIDGERVYFDIDGDFFAERTGWLDGDDGFLALDKNRNGLIDDINELFGGVGQFGFDDLSAYDDNGDEKIDATDHIYSELRVWQDVNQNGRSEENELTTLEELGIISINVDGQALDTVTPQGTTLREQATFTWDTGEVGNVFEAIFELNDVDTRFLGESGTPEWIKPDDVISAKGFGRIANLSVDSFNDFHLQDLVKSAAESMVSPDLKTLREQSGDVLGQWGFALELTRELIPVLLDRSETGTVLVDRAVYVEDASDGFWQLDSGAPILDGAGQVIGRPTLEDVMSQTVSGGQGWQLEQMFSPSTRSQALEHRSEAPYLAEVVDGRVVVLDYGIDNGDGTWRLASGNDVLDAGGAVINDPTRDQIVAQDQNWRVEAIDFNPYASIEVAQVGVNFVDGIVVDYTVEVTDQDGTFVVWARNLDRALELQEKFGTPREFNLRNFEIDFDTLDEVGSTDDSAIRVELLTPGQFHFATSLVGIDFQPQMLSAEIDPSSGVIAYSVNDSGQASLVDGEYVSGIKTIIELLDTVMEQYVVSSRAFAVKLALQGGLQDFARGLDYDVETDSFVGTTDYELAPMFEAIFEHAPAGYEETYAYLQAWNEILSQVYPDYRVDGTGNTFGARINIDQKFIFQMLLPAYEKNALDIDLRAVLNALSINETLLIDHDETATEVNGTSRSDYIYISGGDQTYAGGRGADFYLVGADFGTDTITDLDYGEADELRFSSITSEDIIARREGQDLLLATAGSDDVLTVKNQFLGELNPAFGDLSEDTAMTSIAFADGVVWDTFRIALEVSDPKDTDDIIIGSGSGDVLEGGKGNDVLQGGLGGDFYVFREGDGQDVVRDATAITRLPSKGGIDFIQFFGDISSDDLLLKRDGESSDLQVYLLDDDGNETGDRIIVEDQFDGLVLNLGAFLGQFDPSLGIDYIAPSLIERFLFEDGSSLEFTQIKDRVLESAKTDGEDAIFGFLTGDRLDGGTGDDVLIGREGDDVYVYGRDYGNEVIFDGDFSVDLFGDAKDNDLLKLTDGLRWTDFEFLRDGASDTIELKVEGTEDSLVLRDMYQTGILQGYINLIDRLEFSDGTVWDYTKLSQHLIDLSQTTGDDDVYGWVISDRLDGKEGNDRLEGFSGSDTYVFALGYGQDVIIDASGGNDRIELTDISFGDVDVTRNGEDLIFTVRETGDRLTLQEQFSRAGAQKKAIESFIFTDQTITFTQLNPHVIDAVGTDGDDILRGSNFAEIIDGRAGNDELYGGSDGDTYKFDVGYGEDVIIDKQLATAWKNRQGDKIKETDDRVLFGDDITRENVVFTIEGDDLVISVEDRSDTLRIRDQFASIEDGIERFDFADGTFYLISDVEEILTIVGGNRGDNEIIGVVNAPNVLDGRQGDDSLVGGRDADTYAFGAAYDLDRIIEREDGFIGAEDRIVFGSTVSPENIILRRDGENLLIDLGNGEDQLTIEKGLTTARVEQYLFANGTNWSFTDIQNQILKGSDGDDQLIGFDGLDDRLEGGSGSDALEGGTGGDTYHFEIGFGADAIADTGGTDTISFGVGLRATDIEFTAEGDNLIVRFAGLDDSLVVLGGANLASMDNSVESFVFDDGVVIELTDVLSGLVESASTAGNDIIDARIGSSVTFGSGRGFDAVYLGGASVFTFSLGDGYAEVDLGSSSGNDRIEFTDYQPTDLVVKRLDSDGSDYVLSFFNVGDQITIRNADVLSSLPTIAFADGIEWGIEELTQRLIESQITDGNDVITGSSTSDAIDAGLGNDDLQGGAGNDVYTFKRGDGRDVIADSAGTDVVEITGYLPSEITISRPVQERDEIVIEFAGTDDQIVLRYTANQGVEEVVFSDGTIWSKDFMFQATVGEGTDYDDLIIGSDVADVIAGRAGDDDLRGGKGDDTYLYGLGDGSDIIIDDASSNSGTDKLVLSDFVSNQVNLSATRTDVILMLPTGETITLKDQRNSDADSRIEEIEFANGEIWDVAQIDEQLNLDMRAAGLVVGTTANVTYQHASGDGSYTIDDNLSSSGKNDALVLEGINESDVSIQRDGNDFIVLLPNNEEIRLLNQADRQGYWGVKSVVFDDVTWSRAALNTAALDGQKASGLVEGTQNNETYTHMQGDGSYTISDYRNSSSKNDKLVFSDVEISDVQVKRDGSDFVLLLANGEEIRLLNQAANGDDWGIDLIEFPGGQTWNVSDLRSQALIDGKSLGEVIGTSADEIFTHDLGDGSYTIRELSSSDDRLVFNDQLASDVTASRNGDDMVLTLSNSEIVTIQNQFSNDTRYHVETIQFSDGLQWDRIEFLSQVQADGRAIGALVGDTSDDTFVYRQGDGSFSITDLDYQLGSDRLILIDTLPDDVLVSRSGNDVLLSIGPDVITLVHQLDADKHFEIETVQFTDNSTWTSAQLRGFAIPPEDVLPPVVGTSDGEAYSYALGDGSYTINDYSFQARGGPDVLTLVGIASNQVEFSSIGTDLLISFENGDALRVSQQLRNGQEYGLEVITFDDATSLDRAGIRTRLVADQKATGAVTGTELAEVYTHSLGDGSYTLTDFDRQGLSGSDPLTFTDVNSDQVTFSRTGNDLIITLENEEAVRITSQLNGNREYGVETISFADNVTLDRSQIRNRTVEDLKTTGTVTGTEIAEAYFHSAGDGSYTINDFDRQGLSGSDPLTFTDVNSDQVTFSIIGGNDILLTLDNGESIRINNQWNGNREYGVESINFADNVSLDRQEIRNRTVEDLKATGLATGTAIAEAYFHSAGDGSYRITDYDRQSLSGSDPLTFTDLNSDMVLFSRAGSDLVLTTENSDEIRITRQVDGGREYGVETITFADGVILDRTMIVTRLEEDEAKPTLVNGSAQADNLSGADGVDRLVGREGNDLVSGGVGDDIYVFTKGDGQDTLRDAGSGNDVIEISGYSSTEVSFSQNGRNGPDLIISLGSDGDQITIINGLSSISADLIESILFADTAQTVSLQEIKEKILLGTADSSEDVILGNAANNTLSGGGAADTLIGLGGADRYVYASGDGDDRINDETTSASDTLVLVDYDVADIRYVASAGLDSHDLVIRFTSGTDRVTIMDGLRGGGFGVEAIQFADGTEWQLPDFRQAVISFASTDNGDTVRGFASDDIIAGGLGDDLLLGASGEDTYLFEKGDGHDRIDDIASSTNDVLNLTGLLSSEASVSRLYKGSDTVILGFATSDDKITLTGMLSDDSIGVDQVVFGDGVIWGAEQILAALENNAPIAKHDGIFSVQQANTLILDPTTLLRNDYDADGDDLMIIAVDGGEYGVAEIDGDGNVRFTANDGYFGPSQITYTISDGRNGITSAQIDLRITPEAQARDDDGFEVAEDGFLTIETDRLLSNDIDGDRMIVAQVFGAQNGAVSLQSNGQISFTLSTDFNGLAQFTYAANTPEGGRAEGVVYINVTPANDTPFVRDDDGFVTLEDEAFLISFETLLDNDTDIDGDTLTITSVTGNLDVQVSLTDDGFVLVEPTNFFFGDTYFDYTVSDPDGATDTGRVELNVEPVNNDPIPADDMIETVEDNPILIAAADLTQNDSDPDGEPLVITSVGQASGGRVELFENQTVLFTPFANFFGDGGYSYTVDDGQGGSASARVNVAVTAVNDAPDAVFDSYTQSGLGYLRADEDTSIEISIADLLDNDSDVEGDDIKIETFSDPLNGDIEITDRGTVIFTPDADYWGTASFNYVISDEDGLVDGTTVTLFFDNVGDAPPVAVDDVVSVTEDIPQIIKIADLIANDTDIDRDPLAFVSARLPSVFEGNVNGSLVFNEDGDILYTPDLNSDEAYGFYYTVTDNADGSAEGFVDIQMIAVNDDPVAGNDVFQPTPFDVPLVLRIADLLTNDGDIEDNTVAFSSIDATSAGVAEIYNDEFIVVRFEQGFSGPVDLTYSIADPEGLTDEGFVSGSISSIYDQFQNGSESRDLLIGNALNESFNGSAGNDDIFAGGGNDFVQGGDGADFIEAGTGDDEIDGGIGDDTIDAGIGDDLILGGDGFDDIDGGEGFDTVDFAGSNIGVRADLASRLGQGGFAQGDVYTNIEALNGTQFDDTLGGDEQANVLDGRAGDDLLEGRGGDDTLIAGTGDDVLIGGAGNDDLQGGEGSDTVDYFGSLEAVTVSLENQTATGGDATGDTLSSIENAIGSDEADILIGNLFDNTLRGRRGDDELVGGAGDDTLIGGRGADILRGGDGVDTADYTLSTEGVAINMIDGSAGGGDATGDIFESIEIVQGSFHDDTIIGNASDNIIRGGRGADIIDGGDGFDTADYTLADEGVSVDLATGRGSAGEALGDTLSNIEQLVGSSYVDILTGSDAAETFDGGFGNDVISGAGGSDTYLFGFDSSNDTVFEAGHADDIDRVQLQDGILAKDLSVLREGDDLLLELERDDGFLIDTLRVTDHFLGSESGIEEVQFADGSTWDRPTIESLIRTGRFNAEDDVVPLGFEDEVIVINGADLLRNDAADGVEQLEIISVQNGVNGTAMLNADGSVSFLGGQDYNGNAYFDYTARDEFGRESSAEVRVNLDPVNDAPVANNDGIFEGAEDTILEIPFSWLLDGDTDIDGDNLSIVGLSPLLSIDGEPLDAGFVYDLTNGRGDIGATSIFFEPRPDHSGFAGFIYTVSDGNGGTATAEVELLFNAVNDAPRGRDDKATVRLSQSATFTPEDLLDNDFDIEGDDFSFVGAHSASGGVLEIDPVTNEMTFTPSALGESSFRYDVIDEFGAVATFRVEVTAIPLNDPPKANRDTGFETLEDQVLIIDPSVLLENDSDPNGDLITVTGLELFPDNGRVAFTDDGLIAFTPKSDFNGKTGFVYEISDENGAIDTAFVEISVVPENDAPVLFDDITEGLEDIPILFLAAEAFGNDYDLDGDVLFFESATVLGRVTNSFENRQPFDVIFELTGDKLSDNVVVSLELQDGIDVPEWLGFDVSTLTLIGEIPEPEADPVTGELPPKRDFEALDVIVSLSLSDDANAQFNTNVTVSVDQEAELASGIAIDTQDIAVFDTSQGGFTARLANFRSLPEWLAFDEETLTLSKTEFAPEDGAEVARVQIAYTPPERTDIGSPIASSDGSFAIEFLIDPTQEIDLTINDLLQTHDFFAGQDLFAIDLSAVSAIDVKKENQAELPEWLSFDQETLSFSGIPPEVYVGSVPVRLDVIASDDGSLPNYSIIADVVVDTAFSVSGGQGQFGAEIVDGERIVLTTAEDFNGAFAISYQATDQKDGVSEKPAVVVVNVFAQPETPDAFDDAFNGLENQPLDLSLDQILANDVDDDGDDIRVIAIEQPEIGDLEIILGQIEITRPDGLEDGLFSAALSDGSTLPIWMQIDETTGAISAEIPLDFNETLEITWAVTNDAGTQTASSTQSFDGNADVALTYIPQPNYFGPVTFDYEITDDQQGNGTATVRIDLEAVNELPVARADKFDGFATEPFVMTFGQLLVNDNDPDGATLLLTSVQIVENGAVEIVGEEIVFTPIDFGEDVPPYDYVGLFNYTIRDIDGGEATSRVEINVDANSAPTVVRDTFDGFEDEPLIITREELISNDFDINGADVVSFARISGVGDGGRFFERPDGSYQILSDPDFNGVVEYEYVITDGKEEGAGFFAVDFAAVNDAPAVFDENGFETSEDQPLIINADRLLLNAVDIEGDPLSVSRVFDGNNGSVELVGDQVIFTPRADYFGNADFLFGIQDSFGAESIGKLSLTVLLSDDLPIAGFDSGFDLDEDSFLDFNVSQLLANDFDPDGSDVSFVGFEASPLLTDLGDGSFRFEPVPDANGAFTLSYSIADESGAQATGSVRFDVASVVDAPEARDDMLDGVEDTTLEILTTELTGNDRDADGQGLVITGFENLDGVSVEFDGLGRIIVTPDADRFGSASFDYILEDPDGLTDNATVNINLLAVDDAPEIADLPDLNGTEDQMLSATLDPALIVDRDTTFTQVSIRGVAGAAVPTWLVFEADSLTFAGTPPQDFNGSIDLELVVFDGTTEVSKPLKLTIEAINDAPIATDDSINGGAQQIITIPLETLLANDVDIDGDGLSIASLSSGDGFSAVLDGLGNAVITRDPSLGGQIEVGYTVTDGDLTDTGVVMIDLDQINQSPIVSDIDQISILEDTELNVILPETVAIDPDGDVLALTVTRAGGSALPSWLNFDGATRALTGIPPENFNGTLALELTAYDGQLSETKAFELIVESVNDVPLILAPFSDRFITEDEAFDITLQSNLFTDVDGDTLSFDVRLADGNALPAWVSFDPIAVSLAGTPPTDFNGKLELQITASDGTSSVSDVFELTVLAVNDAPRLLSPLVDVSTDTIGNPLVTGTPFTISVPTDQFIDPENDTLAFASLLADGSELPSWLNFDGISYSGIAPRDAAGTIEIELIASDGDLATSDVFALNFEQGNSAPIAINDAGFEISVPDVLDIDIAVLLANDIDTDSDNLSIVSVTNGANGQVVLQDEFVSYIPELDFDGPDQFTYTITDGVYTSTAAVSVTVSNPFDDVIQGGDGDDRQNGGNGSDLLDGGAGDDRLNGGNGSDVISGGDGNDIANGGNGADTIDGGAGDDRLNGGSGADTITGGTGDDVVNGGQGSDTISGDDGDDRLNGGNGSDLLSGGAGDDELFGGNGRDILLGGDGNDRLFGGSGNDSLSGGAGDDTLFAGNGGDELRGGSGTDRLFGGNGRDTFFFEDGDGRDDIFGFDVSRSGRRSFIAGDDIRLSVEGIESYEDLIGYASQEGNGVLFDFGGGDELFLSGTQLAALDRDQFSFY